MYIASGLDNGSQYVGIEELVKRQGNNDPMQPGQNASFVQQNPQQNPQQSSPTWTVIVGVLLAVVGLVILLFMLYSFLRRCRTQGRSPKYIPTKFLKGRWEAWKPKSKYSSINSSENGQTLETVSPRNSRQTTETPAAAAGVNRNTSIRSIMTLPSYTRQPKETEQIIGREGERGGIDTVLEAPETVEEEEERRDQEMESLYQIRQARRREIAERDERRRERREARERGDTARLEELRREERERRQQNSLTNLAQNSASNVNLTSDMLIAEHNSRGRDRRVSSVSYAAVGQVRHDGTRVRSNSHDSERSGLLSGAAPMGLHNRNGSEATLLTTSGLSQQRYRDRSNSGAPSVSTTASSFENISREQSSQRSSDDRRPTAVRTGTSSHLTTGSISEVDVEESDIGNERVVISGTDSDDSPQPPEYDGHDWGDAPAYTEEERVARANSRATIQGRSNGGVSRGPSTVSRVQSLALSAPSIHVESPTGPNTPVSPVAPFEAHEEDEHRDESETRNH